MTDASRCRACLIACTVFLVAGCGSLGLGEQESGSPKLYRLTAPTGHGSGLNRVPSQLVVSEPIVAGGLQDSRIAVRQSEFELEYYADGRWAVETPEMFRTLLLTSLQNADVLAGVGLRSVRVDPDFSLRTELLRFEAAYSESGSPPFAEVVVNASLVREPEQNVLRSRRFEARATAASEALPDVVAAIDEASDRVLREIVRWTVSR